MKVIQGDGNPRSVSQKEREARKRGLRIGSWVAANLARAAGRTIPAPEGESDEKKGVPLHKPEDDSS